MPGSMRRRGHDSWQLRVYLGLNPDTGKQRWAARTVHGGRRYAPAQLALLVDEAQRRTDPRRDGHRPAATMVHRGLADLGDVHGPRDPQPDPLPS